MKEVLKLIAIVVYLILLGVTSYFFFAKEINIERMLAFLGITVLSGMMMGIGLKE